MKTSQFLLLKRTILALACLCVFTASDAGAGVMASELNPTAIATVAASTSQNLGASNDPGMGMEKHAVGGVETKARGNYPATLPVALMAPVTAMSAIFPIIGLIAAVAVTQLLRRRRIAQLRSSSSRGH